MATYTEILTSLKTALKTFADNGAVQEIEHADGSRVRYSTLEQFLAAIREHETLAAAESAEGTKRPSRTYATFGRRPL